MNGLNAVGEAVMMMANVNMDSEMTKAGEIVALIGGNSALSLDWAKDWSGLAYNYYIDSLNIVKNASYAATAAADYSLYQEAIQQGQLEMGSQDNILQSSKTVLKTLGNAMDQVYNLAQGPVEFLKALSRAILSMRT